MSAPVLDVDARILGPAGWIDLEDEANGYTLHDDFANSRATTQRKTDTMGDWVEGTFTVRAVRENVTESVAVWVDAVTPYAAGHQGAGADRRAGPAGVPDGGPVRGLQGDLADRPTGGLHRGLRQGLPVRHPVPGAGHRLPAADADRVQV